MKLFKKYFFEFIVDYSSIVILFLVFLILVLSSCSKKVVTEIVDVPKVHTEYKTQYKTDSIYLKDSIFINQYIKGDTVFRDKEVIKYRGKSSNKTDTVIVRDTVPSPALVQALKEANEQLVNANIEHKQYQEKTEKYIGLLSKLLGLTTLLLLLTNAKRIYNIVKKIF